MYYGLLLRRDFLVVCLVSLPALAFLVAIADEDSFRVSSNIFPSKRVTDVIFFPN